MDINSWWNIIVYWPLVDSWNNEFVTANKVDIFVPRTNVSTNSWWGSSDTLLMSQKATTEYVDNNTLFKQSDWFIESKTLGWWFKICNNMGTTYTWSQNTCLWNINFYLSWNRNLVNWSMNSTDWNYNTILGDTIKTIWDFNLINWNIIENIWNNNAIFWNRNKSTWDNNLIQGFYNQNRNWNRNLIIWQMNQTVWWSIQNSIIAWLDNTISWNIKNSVVFGKYWVLQNNNSFLFNSSWWPVYSEKNNSFVVYTDWMAINKRSADIWIKLDVNWSIQTNEALYIGSSRRFIIDSDNLSVQNLSWWSRVEKHSFTP